MSVWQIPQYLISIRASAGLTSRRWVVIGTSGRAAGVASCELTLGMGRPAVQG
jgi:hypothetical protein